MGRINPWKTSIALAVGLVASAGAGVALAQGGISANLALSGTLFDIAIGDVQGKDFNLFVDKENMGEGKKEEAVARLTFDTAKASDLCISAKVGNVPTIGPITFTLKSPGQNTVDAKNLVVGAKDLDADLAMDDVVLGADINKANPAAPSGAWGLVTKSTSIQAEHITATSVSASKLSVKNLQAGVKEGEHNDCGG